MKVKLSFQELGSLLKMVIMAISFYGNEMADEDRLIVETLKEMQLKFSIKLMEQKRKYSITLKPTWAFAIRTIFAGGIRHNFETNMMGRLCDDIYHYYTSEDIKKLGLINN